MSAAVTGRKMTTAPRGLVCMLWNTTASHASQSSALPLPLTASNPQDLKPISKKSVASATLWFTFDAVVRLRDAARHSPSVMTSHRR
jgi:hypothetical protein